VLVGHLAACNVSLGVGAFIGFVGEEKHTLGTDVELEGVAEVRLGAG
jgi:hypothetical protein